MNLPFLGLCLVPLSGGSVGSAMNAHHRHLWFAADLFMRSASLSLTPAPAAHPASVRQGLAAWRLDIEGWRWSRGPEGATACAATPALRVDPEPGVDLCEML